MYSNHLGPALPKLRRRFGLTLRFVIFHWGEHLYPCVLTNAAHQIVSSPLEDAKRHALVSQHEFEKRVLKPQALLK